MNNSRPWPHRLARVILCRELGLGGQLSPETEGILAAFVPAVIWLGIVYTRDRYERDPKILVAWLFLAGGLAVGIAIVLEKALQINLIASTGVVILSALAIGVIEEGSKFAVTYVFTRGSKHLREPVDGMVYASAVALGFAAFETSIKILGIYHSGVRFLTEHGYGVLVSQHAASRFVIQQVAVPRAVTGCLGHLAFTGITGYAYGMERTGGGSKRSLRNAFIAAALLHAGYDGFLALKAPTLSYGILVFSIALYTNRFHHALSVSPFRKNQLRPTPPAPPVGHPILKRASTPAPTAMAPTDKATTGTRPTVDWRPTHIIPQEGLGARIQPNLTSPLMGVLAGGTQVEVLEQVGVWAHVLTTQGWSGWVDGRALVPIGST